MKKINFAKLGAHMFTTSLFALLLFVACNREPMSEGQLDPQTKSENIYAKMTYKGIEIDTAAASEAIRLDMVKFVNGVREHYTEGMSYSQLKNTLDPSNNLTSITQEGDDLLFEAYTNIANNVNDNDIKGQKMAAALNYILTNNLDSEITDISDVDFESGSLLLFGLDDSYTTMSSSGSCKWYQIGCHLSNFWNWLNSDANGDAPGTVTNLQAIGAAVSALVGLVTVIEKL